MDSARSRRSGRRLSPEHQLHRERPLRAEPPARPHVRARVQVHHGRHLHTREEAMSLPLPAFVDERFLKHRLRATSNAGIASAALALLLFMYRYYHDHVFRTDLL